MIISFLITAWFLSLFDLDETLINAINEILNTQYSTNVYWLSFFIIGLILDIIITIFK